MAITHVSRGTLTGSQITDGLGTTLTFASQLGLQVWEIEVEPAGESRGDAINCTTHHNTAYRTFAPPTLKTVKPVKVTGSIDKSAITSLMVLMTTGSEVITLEDKDTSKYSFYGYLDSWSLGPKTEGNKPTVELIVQPTNRDATGAEKVQTTTQQCN